VTRAKISQYSATANDNTDVNGVNIAEGCPPSSMNNMGREIMAALKRFQVGSDGDGVTVGGSLVVSGSTTVNTFNVDVISEKTSAAGVTVDGVLLKDSQVSTDQINEKTSAAGVTIDSVLLKDGLVGIGADGSASAPSIYRASDTNTGIFFPAADTIAFAEGGAEAMRIDSDGDVGIGTNSPGARLDVLRGSTNTVAFDEPQIRVINSATATANQRVDIAMRWQDGTYNGTGGISMLRESATARSGALIFAPIASDGNGTERARITSDGYLRMASGTGGIQFGGDTAAANALDDYEQGTWTPTYIASTSNPTVTYQAQNGSYVKIGEFVHFSLELETSAVSGGSGLLRVGGLPFTTSSQRYPGGGFTTYSDQFTTNAPDAGWATSNGTFIALTYHSSATAQVENSVTNLTNGTSKNYLLFTGSYRSA